MDQCISQNQIKKYVGQKVYVFKEVKNNVWTVWTADRKRKLFWVKSLTLEFASFFVDEKKRQSVVKSKKKLPHAGIFGTIKCTSSATKKNVGSELYYNPFKTKLFQNRRTEQEISEGKLVVFSESGKVFGKGLK